MARKATRNWDALLAEYAQAHIETGIKPQAWFESHVDPDGWSNAKRYISAKKAKALIDSGAIPLDQNNNKKSHNSAISKKASKTSQKTSQKANAKESGKISKSLINKGKETDSNSSKEQKKRVSQSANTAPNILRSKQPHGAISQPPDDHEQNTAHFEYSECGATTRMGSTCRKQSGWGTDHFGFGRCRLHGGKGGAPEGNQNAIVDGIYSQYLDPEEASLYQSMTVRRLDLTDEIAMTRIELKRCYELAAIQRDLMGGPEGAFEINKIQETRTEIVDGDTKSFEVDIERPRLDSVRELAEHEEGLSGEGYKDVRKYKVRDYTEIANRLMGRLMNLIRQQTQLANYLPTEDRDDIVDHYLSEFEAQNLTAIQVGSGLARFGIKTPEVISVAMRAEAELQGAGNKDGLSDEELDALVKEKREGMQQIFNENMVGRENIVERMKRGEDIDLENLDLEALDNA